MERQLDAYCTHLRSERQVSPHTLEAYRRDLNKVLAFCSKESIATWTALDIQRLRQLVSRLHQQGQSSRSIARLLSAVRGLYHYLNREGLCDHDPANGLAPPKGERRLPKTLDTDRALQLLEGAVEEDFLALRDQAILELFYSSGLRLSELTGLNLDQLDLADGLVEVLGKGSKTRVLPVGKRPVKRCRRGWRYGRWPTRRMMRCSSVSAADVLDRVPSSCGSRPPASANWDKTCIRTCCVTHLPAICWSPLRTCAPCKSCSGMPTSKPLKSIPIWISSIWQRSMTAPIPGPNAVRAVNDD